MTGTIANAHGVDVMERLCPDFPKSRVCNIAIEVPGSPSVLIDNTRGMRRLVEHMIRVHGHRRIAFVRGPESNPEAEARYAAYRDVLAAHHLPLDENLIVQGDFLREAGARAVQTLFDDRDLSPSDIDAIIAADDLMALATLENWPDATSVYRLRSLSPDSTMLRKHATRLRLSQVYASRYSNRGAKRCSSYSAP